jgi:lipoprotein-releasing system permease protein
MASKSRPFSGFEWMVALRYLKPRRKEAFVSVISILSLIGIALGVATLIIVMSVMNGFRAELLGRILGSTATDRTEPHGSIPDYDALAGRLRMIPA